MNERNHSIKSYLDGDDPLSDDACEYLLEYQEEDTLVDYKESFNSSSDKSWIDLAVDIMSFANTNGGYLVFGIKDKIYERVGIDNVSYESLCDIKKLLEKVNRNIQPKFSDVRTKGKLVDDRKYVFLFVPPIINRTHVFEQNLSYKPAPGRDSITVIRQGAIYTRKSGSNQVLTSDAFEDLLNRRIQRFRSKILDGLTRVVSSELDQEMVVVTPEQASDGVRTFTVTDSTDGIEIKGVKLTIKPESLEDKVSAWIAINQSDNRNLPTERALMELYENRHNVSLNADQSRYIAYFSMIKGLPAFFWLRSLDNNTAIEAIEASFEDASNIEKLFIINIAGFYGDKEYNKLKSKYGQTSSQVRVENYKNLHALFKTNSRRGDTSAEKESTELAKRLSGRISMSDIYTLRKLDCALYAPFQKS